MSCGLRKEWRVVQDPNRIATGMYLRGYVTATLADLTSVLGYPFRPPRYETNQHGNPVPNTTRLTCRWSLVNTDGSRASIYLMGEEAVSPDNQYLWHLGARCQNDAHLVLRWLELLLRDTGKGSRDVVPLPWLMPPGMEFYSRDDNR